MLTIQRSCLLAALIVVVVANHASVAPAQDWQPQPENAAIMVISSHPDDEGIFFGGAIPYYTQVRQLPMVHISMTSGDWGRPPEVREEELRNADWVYGLRNEPLFPRFKDYPTSTLDETWDVWADGELDGNGVEEGREKAGLYVAEQIRRYRPDVIIAHDFDGEYGHNNHKASAFAVADAYDLAADAGVDLAGLDPWLTPKLYMHRYSNYRPISVDPSITFINDFEHDWDTPYAQSAGMTPMEIADLGLAEHVSQGGASIPGNWTGRRYAEEWGLLASTVGTDTLDDDGIARGDFFEHIDLSIYDAPIIGDLNGDGVLDTADWQNYRAGMREDLSGLTHEQAYQMGDMDGDFDNDLIDFGYFRTAYDTQNGQGAFGSMIAGVPEPTTAVLALFLLAAVGASRLLPREGVRPD